MSSKYFLPITLLLLFVTWLPLVFLSETNTPDIIALIIAIPLSSYALSLVMSIPRYVEVSATTVFRIVLFVSLTTISLFIFSMAVLNQKPVHVLLVSLPRNIVFKVFLATTYTLTTICNSILIYLKKYAHVTFEKQ